jgi:hypothetical protein
MSKAPEISIPPVGATTRVQILPNESRNCRIGTEGNVKTVGFRRRSFVLDGCTDNIRMTGVGWGTSKAIS